jgi:hypothetical protein
MISNNLYGQWIVPTQPASHGGLIYLFNAIETDAHEAILQPVLTWGYDGYYWEIVAVLGSTDGNYYYSPFLSNVSDGDVILGQTWVTGQSGGTLDWECEVGDANTGRAVWITTTSSGLHWRWAYASALEAYFIQQCNQFPNTTFAQFYNVSVYTGVYPQHNLIANQFSAPLNSNGIPDSDSDSDDYPGPVCQFSAGYSNGSYFLNWSPQ